MLVLICTHVYEQACVCPQKVPNLLMCTEGAGSTLHDAAPPDEPSTVYDPRAATWMQKALQSKRLWGEEMQGNDEAASCRQVVRF